MIKIDFRLLFCCNRIDKIKFIERMIFMAEKTNVYPYRAPKKYPKKDLHGRPRFCFFLTMISNVFRSFT